MYKCSLIVFRVYVQVPFVSQQQHFHNKSNSLRQLVGLDFNISAEATQVNFCLRSELYTV